MPLMSLERNTCKLMASNKRIGDICEILNGFAFKSDEYVENGIRVMRITNVQKGQVVDDDPKFFPAERKREIEKYLLREGDLLMSLTGNVGRVGLLPKAYLPAALNQRVACLRIKSEVVLMDYLFHALNSNNFEEDCIFNASGIAQKNMSTRWLEDYRIPVPSIADQERIVAELNLLSGILEKQKAQLKELDILAQSIFYDMFGNPVTNDKCWSTEPLSRVAPQKSFDGVIPSVAGKYWLLNLDMVEQQTGRVIERVLFTKSEIGNSTTTFDTSNVLYSKLRPYLNKVVIPDGIGFATSELIPLKPNTQVLDRVYFASLLRSKSFVDYISVKVAGAKMPRVSMDVLRAFPVILPPLSLQQFFSAKIEAIERQNTLINQSIVETQKLFDYTMDKYFG